MWFIHIIEALLFSYIAYLSGTFILSFFRWRGGTGLHISLAITIGYGCIACASLVLGLFGWLYSGVLYAIGTIVLICSYKIILYHLINITDGSQWKICIKRIISHLKHHLIPTIIIAVWLLTYLLIALSPTTMGKDGLAYHLPFAAEISNTHSMSFPILGHAEYGQLPILGEVLYAALLTLFGDLGALKLIQASTLILLIGCVVFTLRRTESFGSTSSYIFIALALACTPIVRNALSGAMVDIWAFLFGISSLVLISASVFPTNKDSRKPDYIIAGILMGLAVSVKYLALFMAAIGVLLIITSLVIHKERLGQIMRTLARFIIPAIIVGGFWYIKNLVLTGNPFYPIFASGNGAEFTTEVQAFLIDRTWYNFFVFPFKLFGPETYHLPFGVFTSGIFAITYITFIFLAIRKKIISSAALMLIAAETYLAGMFLWSHQIRFIAPAILMATIALVIMLRELALTFPIKNKRLHAAVAILFVFVLFLAGTLSFKEELSCMKPNKIDSCYEKVEGGAYYAIRYIEQELHGQKVIEYFNQFYHYGFKGSNSLTGLYCADKEDAAIDQCLRANNTLYYLDDTNSRTHPWMRNADEKIRTANYFIRKGKVVFEFEDVPHKSFIRLYTIK